MAVKSILMYLRGTTTTALKFNKVKGVSIESEVVGFVD